MAGARDRGPGSKTGSETKHQCADGLLRASCRPPGYRCVAAVTSPQFLIAWVAGTAIAGSKVAPQQSNGPASGGGPFALFFGFVVALSVWQLRHNPELLTERLTGADRPNPKSRDRGLLALTG